MYPMLLSYERLVTLYLIFLTSRHSVLSAALVPGHDHFIFTVIV